MPISEHLFINRHMGESREEKEREQEICMTSPTIAYLTSRAKSIKPFRFRRRTRRTIRGGDCVMVTPFDRMLWDVSKFRSPATCMPRRAVIRTPSEDSSQADMLVEKDLMVAKTGVPLALDPKQFIFIKFTGLLSFWFPVQQDGPVRRIAVYADKWNSDRSFDCIFCPPVFRDESQTVCYNGGTMQTFRLICKSGKIVAVRTNEGYITGAPPPQSTLDTMADTFSAYIQSSALF